MVAFWVSDKGGVKRDIDEEKEEIRDAVKSETNRRKRTTKK